MFAQVAPFHSVPVRDAWDETPTLRGLRVELGELARSHTVPGQVVKLRTPAGEAFVALASPPGAPGPAELLVKRGAPVADAVIAAATQGAQIECSAPFGRGFPLAEAAGRDLLLFAAGSGISPIRALVHHLLSRRDEFGRVTLFYGQRGSHFAYAREHLSWERRGVRVVLCSSAAEPGWQGLRGRVSEIAPALAFGGSSPREAVAFVCGMREMVDGVRRVLEGAGMPPGRVLGNH